MAQANAPQLTDTPDATQLKQIYSKLAESLGVNTANAAPRQNYLTSPRPSVRSCRPRYRASPSRRNPTRSQRS